MNNLSFEEIVATKPLKSYSKEQIQNIKLLSTNKHHLAQPFGSSTYKIQKYPGDLDLYDVFLKCCSIDEVIRKFETIIVKIATDIKNEKLHYFSEFKAGLDNRYDINIGSIKNGTFDINRKEVKNKSKKLFEKNLLNKNEYFIITQILDKDLKFTLNGDDYDVLHYIFRNRKIVRWSLEDILQRYIILPDNTLLTLYNALHIQTHVKIDMITYINGKFTEVTNFYILIENKNGHIYNINLDYNFLDRNQAKNIYDKQIKDEIEKLYFSNMYYSPFKMAKRIWAYSRLFKDKYTVEILLPIISGNISLLYQIKSEIDAIIRIYYISKSIPINSINLQIDGMKFRISNVIQLKNNQIQYINNIINSFLIESSKSKRVKILKFLNQILKNHINRLTIISLNNIRFNPPPLNLLPKQLKYEFIVRLPQEIVKNPLEKYELIGNGWTQYIKQGPYYEQEDIIN